MTAKHPPIIEELIDEIDAKTALAMLERGIKHRALYNSCDITNICTYANAKQGLAIIIVRDESGKAIVRNGEIVTKTLEGPVQIIRETPARKVEL